MLHIQTFQFNMFGVNTYVVWDDTTAACAIVDPGMIDDSEEARLDTFITGQRLHVGQILCTHQHLDHIFGVDRARRRYGVGMKASAADAFLGRQAPAQARMFGLDATLVQPVEADAAIADGDRIALAADVQEADGDALAIAVPGHSPGSLAYYFPSAGFVLTGDALFQGSIGRTDLVAGNHTLLIDSIRTRLLTLPGDTVVLPGHGPSTTIAAELRSNPYIQG